MIGRHSATYGPSAHHGIVDLRSNTIGVLVMLVIALHKSPKSFLDTVSTGSGSDLVGDQHAISPNDS